MHGGEPHQLRRAVDEIDARERRADERAHAIERELKDLLRPVGREEGVHDLADRDELAQPGLGALRGAARPLARAAGVVLVTRANMGMERVKRPDVYRRASPALEGRVSVRTSSAVDQHVRRRTDHVRDRVGHVLRRSASTRPSSVGSWPLKSVATAPGITTDTFTPRSRTSSISDSAHDVTNAFVAA